MKVVKFNKAYSPYAPGDTAGLEDKQAAELIKASVYVAYSAKEVKSPLYPEQVN